LVGIHITFNVFSDRDALAALYQNFLACSLTKRDDEIETRLDVSGSAVVRRAVQVNPKPKKPSKQAVLRVFC
jgi:hypothetical protein